MTEVSRIVDELLRAYDGDPWHGPNLTSLIDGITADVAAAHPIPGAHSILEIVLHIAAWMGEAGQRLNGASPGQPAEEDWPDPGDTGEAGWTLARAKLAQAHDALLRSLSATPEERLWQVVGSQIRDRADGTGTTYYVLLHGVVQHNVYHSAQIGVLRRLQEGR